MRQILYYPGGKARIARWIVEHLPEHQVYCEPFGGSAAVLLEKTPSRLEIYNDLDGELVNFLETLAHRPKPLLAAIEHTLYARSNGGNGSTKPARGKIERARRFFGQNATTWFDGTFKTQRRAQERTVIDVFEKRKEALPLAAERLRRVIFEHLDYLRFIEKYDGPDVLFYCDPPYLGSGRKPRLYQFEMMDESAHRRLATLLHKCQGSVVLSGYSSELYKELYGDWTVAARHAQTNAKDSRQECLWIKPMLNGSAPKSIAVLGERRPTKELIQRHIALAARCILNGKKAERYGPPHKYEKSLWKIFQNSPEGISWSEIVRKCKIPQPTITRYLQRWKNEGRIGRIAKTGTWHALNNNHLSSSRNPLTIGIRAETNGISLSSQSKLDQIARQQPQLLEQIKAGKLSISAAWRLCRPPKSDLGLRLLRAAWKKATETERAIFRGEIDEGTPV